MTTQPPPPQASITHNSIVPATAPVSLVTGASRGIGLAVVRALAAQGGTLAITARDSEDFRAAEAELAETLGPANVLAVPGDLTDDAFVPHLFQSVEHRFGRVDRVVHCAGVAPYGPIQTMPVSDFRRCIEVNLVSAYAIIQQAVVSMQKRGGPGKVLIVGSVRSHWALFGDFGAYPASKYGLRGLVEAVTRQLHSEKSDIAVGLVCPGRTDTRMGNPSGTPARDLMPPETVATAVMHALNAPPGVNVYDTIVFPTGMHPW